MRCVFTVPHGPKTTYVCLRFAPFPQIAVIFEPNSYTQKEIADLIKGTFICTTCTTSGHAALPSRLSGVLATGYYLRVSSRYRLDRPVCKHQMLPVYMFMAPLPVLQLLCCYSIFATRPAACVDVCAFFICRHQTVWYTLERHPHGVSLPCGSDACGLERQGTNPPTKAQLLIFRRLSL